MRTRNFYVAQVYNYKKIKAFASENNMSHAKSVSCTSAFFYSPMEPSKRDGCSKSANRNMITKEKLFFSNVELNWWKTAKHQQKPTSLLGNQPSHR